MQALIHIHTYAVIKNGAKIDMPHLLMLRQILSTTLPLTCQF